MVDPNRMLMVDHCVKRHCCRKCQRKLYLFTEYLYACCLFVQSEICRLGLLVC